MSDFDIAVEHVRDEEGGLIDRPSDPGGRTNFGITQRLLDEVRRAYPADAYPAKVDDLTWEQAREIYLVHFWRPLRGDDLPPGISLMLLDSAVNSSVSRAAKWLQSSVGVAADGWIGMKTLAAVRRAQPLAVLSEISARRAFHYMTQDSIDDEYGLGWARRLFRTFNAAVRELSV